MPPVTLTSIELQADDFTTVRFYSFAENQFRDNSVIFRRGSNRRWKVLSFILAMFCVILITVIIFMTFNRTPACDPMDEAVTKTTTEINTNDIMDTTADFSDHDITLFDRETDVLPMKTVSNGVSTTSTTIITNIDNIFTPADPSTFSGFEKSFGLSLSHSLYYNIPHFSSVAGYVTSVTLRLFVDWEGDNPLYLFSISAIFLEHQITQRYPLNPERNTTEWQTIEIPLRKFSIQRSSLLAVGMHDYSETNKIYAVRSVFSVHGQNITGSTQLVHPQATGGLYGVAFTYTVFRNEES